MMKFYQQSGVSWSERKKKENRGCMKRQLN
jgi:hypothetical protein